jgi:nucleoid-associated protein YgaU
MSALSPAYILNLENQAHIEFMFNPKDFTYAKSNSWGGKDDAGAQKNAPELTFTGGESATLKIQLFFDTYHKATNGKAEDVRNYTSKLWDLMKVGPKEGKSQHGRPPFVKFFWGSHHSFAGVIESISEQFTMFMPDGTPVRATVDVGFKQKGDDDQMAWTNPTSGGKGGERMWIVKDGDTLARIAYVTLGDSSHWRKIADTNDIKSIRRLSPGQSLVIPVD